LVLNKVILFKHKEESKLKSQQDSVWMAEDIMDQFILCKEIQHILNISLQLVIGLPRFGPKILRAQLCKHVIIKAI